jgi:hypothetical protein
MGQWLKRGLLIRRNKNADVGAAEIRTLNQVQPYGDRSGILWVEVLESPGSSPISTQCLADVRYDGTTKMCNSLFGWDRGVCTNR